MYCAVFTSWSRPYFLTQHQAQSRHSIQSETKELVRHDHDDRIYMHTENKKFATSAPHFYNTVITTFH